MQIAQLLALVIFVLVSLMEKNLRGLRDYFKHKIRSHRRVSHGPRHSFAPMVGHDVPGDGRRGPRPRRGRVCLQQPRVAQPSSFNGPPGHQWGSRRSRWFPQYQSVSFAPFILTKKLGRTLMYQNHICLGL